MFSLLCVCLQELSAEGYTIHVEMSLERVGNVKPLFPLLAPEERQELW